MSKKNSIYLLVLVVLGIAAYLLMNKNTKGTMGDLKAFAIEDTTQIEKVSITNKAGAQVILTKDTMEGWWMVNNRFHARKALISLIMEAFQRMEVKAPVPTPAVENILKSMSSSATRVDVFGKDGEVLKSFYLGGTTQDDLGTYMLLSGEEKPQVVHLPGFNGYISARFFVRPIDWKDATVFGMAPQELDWISLKYTNDLKASFKVKLIGDEVAQITNFAGDTAKENVDGKFFRNYLTKYRSVEYETLMDTSYLSLSEMDSVRNSKPYCVVTVMDKKGKEHEAVLYLFPEAVRKQFAGSFPIYSKSGQPILSESERLYCLLKESNELTVVQNYSFRNILVTYNDFFAPKQPM